MRARTAYPQPSSNLQTRLHQNVLRRAAVRASSGLLAPQGCLTVALPATHRALMVPEASVERRSHSATLPSRLALMTVQPAMSTHVTISAAQHDTAAHGVRLHPGPKRNRVSGPLRVRSPEHTMCLGLLTRKGPECVFCKGSDDVVAAAATTATQLHNGYSCQGKVGAPAAAASSDIKTARTTRHVVPSLAALLLRL